MFTRQIFNIPDKSMLIDGGKRSWNSSQSTPFGNRVGITHRVSPALCWDAKATLQSVSDTKQNQTELNSNLPENCSKNKHRFCTKQLSQVTTRHAPEQSKNISWVRTFKSSCSNPQSNQAIGFHSHRRCDRTARRKRGLDGVLTRCKSVVPENELLLETWSFPDELKECIFVPYRRILSLKCHKPFVPVQRKSISWAIQVKIMTSKPQQPEASPYNYSSFRVLSVVLPEGRKSQMSVFRLKSHYRADCLSRSFFLRKERTCTKSVLKWYSKVKPTLFDGIFHRQG